MNPFRIRHPRTACRLALPIGGLAGLRTAAAAEAGPDAATSASQSASSLIELATSPLVGAIVALAIGLWLLLPRGSRRGSRLGLVVVAVGLILLAWHIPAVMNWASQSVLAALALGTVLACVAAVTSRNPMYSALWFGVALLGTACLFLFLGAQFLSVATITVYAGAILVTFLFVLMLAQPAGQAVYDRVSWEAPLAALTGALVIGLVFGLVDRSLHATARAERGAAAEDLNSPLPATAAESVQPDAWSAPMTGEGTPDLANGVLAGQHVASLGRELLGRHLVSMQLAAALMLAALVGAVAIVAQGKTIHRQQRSSPRQPSPT